MQRTRFLPLLALAAVSLFSSPAVADHDNNRFNGHSDRGTEIILYSKRNFRGEARVYYGDVDTLVRDGFNDRARSVEIRGGAWTLCKDRGGQGRCRTVNYSVSDLGDLGLDCKLTSFYQSGYSGAAGYGAHGAYGAQGGAGHSPYPVTLFTRDNFDGLSVGVTSDVNLRDIGFNNKADSILISQGSWIVCTRRDLEGRCQVIDRSVRNLDRLDLGEKISSIAPYQNGRRYSRRGW